MEKQSCMSSEEKDCKQSILFRYIENCLFSELQNQKAKKKQHILAIINTTVKSNLMF